ncbi:MAG TPA: MASE1 domain-containing protein, partial [Steroidobacteraceae bacterium]|nr:MASE1 domain-containing protein [Steroidobacteraceae bacterium]
MARSVPFIVRIVALAIVYYVIGRVGLLLAIPPGYATLIWPPSGIALAALILWGARVWPGVALGSFLLNIVIALAGASLNSLSLHSWAIAAGIAFGSTVQAMAIRALLHRVFGSPISLGSWRDVVRLLVIAGPCGCVIAATVGAVSMWLAHAGGQASFAHNWLTWWAGDALGVVIF